MTQAIGELGKISLEFGEVEHAGDRTRFLKRISTGLSVVQDLFSSNSSARVDHWPQAD